MNARQRFIALLSAAGLAAVVATPAAADPLPGRDLLKFSQQPMDQTAVVGQIYWGHDEPSTAYAPTGLVPTSYRGRFTADDFADTFATPVVHVKWWGSYLNQSDQFGHVNKFLIAFEQDVPNPNPLGFSYPDPAGPIHSQIVTLGALSPQSGTFTEKFVSGGGAPLNEALYEYNAELAIPFPQQKDTVHWLKIVALVDHAPTINPLLPGAPVTRWGWHNRDYTQQNLLASPAVSPGEHLQAASPAGLIWHFQDDAVTGEVAVTTFVNTAGVEVVGNVAQFIGTFDDEHYIDNVDGPTGIVQFSQDQAFELYTVVPEPATCLLMVAGLFGIAACRRTSKC
jgi:hypothetical protein